MTKQEYKKLLTIDTINKFSNQLDYTLQVLQQHKDCLDVYKADELNEKHLRRLKIKQTFHFSLDNPQKYRFILTLASILKQNSISVEDVLFIKKNLYKYYKLYQYQTHLDNQHLNYFESLIFNNNLEK